MWNRQIALIILLCTGVLGTTNAGQLVVVASTTPTLKVGAIIDGSHTVSLPANTSATLISSRGKTIRLTGPYKGQPDPSSGAMKSDLLESLSRLVTVSPENDPSLAVFRAAADSAPPPLWSINVDRSDTYCLPPGKPVVLWRSQANREAILTLRKPNAGVDAQRDWPKGEQGIAWPEELPLVHGITYEARLNDGSPRVRLTVMLMPSDLPTAAHQAAWMAHNECVRQARRLVRAIADGSL